MDRQLFYAICTLVASLPYVAIVVILAHYFIRRALWKRNRNRGRPCFYPSSAALGMVFLFAQTFYRPSLKHLTEVRQVVEVEDDDQGDPEEFARGLDRQLKRVRRGEQVDSLILRL
jgi:hypothetical protein